MKRAILLVILCALPRVIQASEPKAYIMGDESCATFVNAAKEYAGLVAGETRGQMAGVAYLSFISWFGGFVSGVNAERKTDVLEETDMQGALIWIRRYCEKHPLDTFRSTANSLLLEVTKGRPAGK